MEELKNIIDINKINELLRRGLKVEKIGSWIWVSGHTLQHKNLLKSYGFKYSRNKFAWSYHKGGRYHKRTHQDYNLQELREMF